MRSIEGPNERVGSEGSGVRLEGGILLEQTRVCALGICKYDQPLAIRWGVKPSKGHAPLNATSNSHTHPGCYAVCPDSSTIGLQRQLGRTMLSAVGYPPKRASCRSTVVRRVPGLSEG